MQKEMFKMTYFPNTLNHFHLDQSTSEQEIKAVYWIEMQGLNYHRTTDTRLLNLAVSNMVAACLQPKFCYSGFISDHLLIMLTIIGYQFWRYGEPFTANIDRTAISHCLQLMLVRFYMSPEDLSAKMLKSYLR